jgi:hypothetical protein
MNKIIILLLCFLSITTLAFADVIVQQPTASPGRWFVLGGASGVDYRKVAQSFQLTAQGTVTDAEVREDDTVGGTPTGNWTLRIETDNSNKPSGTLADANASVVVSPPGVSTVVKGTFATSFTLSASTKYWLVVVCSLQSNGNYWSISGTDAGYSDGSASDEEDGVWNNYPTQDLYFKIYGTLLGDDSQVMIIN